MSRVSRVTPPPPAAARAAARHAGLRYVTDDAPGFSRQRRGHAFRYFDARGRPIAQAATCRRIDALAIPPAWTDVWICPLPNGHIQATGRDARGRKQYRYHPRWRTERDEAKFEHMAGFARALPVIRRRVAADLRGAPTERTTVLAALVRLLDTTLIRVGNEEYARQNHSFGLSTMRRRHVAVHGAKLDFHFRGKSGRQHQVRLEDPRVAAVVRRLQLLPGQELFQYVGADGRRVNIGSTEINDYLREIAGTELTAKDFRTWAATLEAARLLALAAGGGRRRTKARVQEAIAAVAARLGNTPAICRKCYVHPGLVTAYLSGAPLEPAGRSDLARQRALLRMLRRSREA